MNIRIASLVNGIKNLFHKQPKNEDRVFLGYSYTTPIEETISPFVVLRDDIGVFEVEKVQVVKGKRVVFLRALKDHETITVAESWFPKLFTSAKLPVLHRETIND